MTPCDPPLESRVSAREPAARGEKTRGVKNTLTPPLRMLLCTCRWGGRLPPGAGADPLFSEVRW